MVQLAALVAGLLLIAESEASDVADRSALQGFLSKYVPFGSDASKSSMSNYDKFINPNLNHVKRANELGASPFTIVDDKPVPHPSPQAQDSMEFKSTRGKPSISNKDFDASKIVVRGEKKAVQKMLASSSSSSTPISLYAIGAGLFSLVTMLGVLIQRWMQSGTILIKWVTIR